MTRRRLRKTGVGVLLGALSVAPAAQAAPGASTPGSLRMSALSQRIDPNVDRVQLASARGAPAEAMAITDGSSGGASLWLGEGDHARRVLATQAAITSLAWSDDGQQLAFVEAAAPSWLGTQPPMLQFHGQLFVASPNGSARRVGNADTIARVLGFLNDGSLLVTRYLPGDLPEERPARVELATGTLRDVLPASPASHLYNFALVGGELLYVRSPVRLVTLPPPGLTLELLALDLKSGQHRVVRSEVGQLPTRIRESQPGILSYDLDGKLLTRHLRALDATSFTETIPPARVPLGLPANVDFLMPYVHQVYDTPNDFNGHWACGPTATLMAILRYKRLEPWTETVNVPSPHESPFGAYISRKYTAFGTSFDRGQGDANGTTAWGGYGWCTEGGAAWAWRMQDYAKNHGLQSDFDGSATLAKAKAAIDANKIVVLSTQLTSAGHIITLKGYTSDGKIIVNDPYGNANQGYTNYAGEGATYSWSQLSAKWLITVYSSAPDFQASLVSADCPTTLSSGETAQVSFTLKNDGAVGWDSGVKLGTSEPRDRESELFTDGSWLSPTRAASVSGLVLPGEQVTLSFTVTAPAVCTPTSYAERFNLVQDGLTWFSDAAGPGDDVLGCDIQVEPAGGCDDAGSSSGDAGAESSAGGGSGWPDPGQGGGNGSDAGTSAPTRMIGSSDQGGCACSLPGGRGSSTAAWWLGVLAAPWLLRRRSRSR